MLTPGCTVGNIKIGKLLGRGAMGEVYSGEQVTLKRQVAIKRIASHLADDPEIIQRFAREAQCVAMINSPNVVTVFEFGQFIDDQNDKHYLIIMELVDGGYDLKSCIGTEISWQQASSVIMQVADGLVAAAEHDVIHRDIKPDNIMLSKKGVAKLADFGLAKNVDSTAMTMEGTLMGTPNYMPPEACRGEEVDSRGDIYSLGATWYHLISGMPLFNAANTMALLRAHCEEEPKPLREVVPDIPESVDQFILSCVAKDKDARPTAAAIYKFIQGLDGVPQKVPELVRIAAQSRERKADSGSTMATLQQSMPGDDDKTFMAGADGEAETMVTGQYQQQDQSATATAVAGPDGNTLMAGSSPSAAAATIPAGSAAAAGPAQAPKSKAPLIIGLVVVLIAAVVGIIVVNSPGEENKNETPVIKKDPENGNQITPTVNVENPVDESHTGEQPQDAGDVSAMVKSVNEAIAAKEYKKAQAAYDKLAEQSAEHGALLTQIKDGQQNQQVLADELKQLKDKKEFATLAAKLERARAYPELKTLCEECGKAIDAFKQQVLADMTKTETLVEQEHWKAAAGALTAVPITAAAIGEETHKKRGALQKQIDAALLKQNAVESKLRQMHIKEQFALLSPALAEAEPFPELSDDLQKYKDAIAAFEKETTAALTAVEAEIAKKFWSSAAEKLKPVSEDKEKVSAEILGKRKQLSKQITAELDKQNKVADSLKAIHDKGQFAVLERALPKAADFPELETTVAGYKKAIDEKQKAVAADLSAAAAAGKSGDYATAQAKLNAVGEDPLVIGKDAVVQAATTKEQLVEGASAAVDNAVNAAIAGLESGDKEGYVKAVQALRGAVPAARISGREEELNAKILKLAEIIENRSQQE